MANTTYTDNVTVISADTMNDLNRLHYTIFGDPATGAEAVNNVIAGMTADATPDPEADYVPTLDASASTGKKVLLQNLFVNPAKSISLGVADRSVLGVTMAQNWTLAWTQSATESLPNIFRVTGSASCMVGFGVKWSTNSNEVLSSYGASTARAAIEVGAGYIDFFANTAATVAVGTAVTLNKWMRLTSAGNLGIGINNPSYKLVVSDNGAASIEFDPTASTPLLQVYNRSTLAYSNLQVSAATIRFFAGATPAEAARIDGNRYLLVGYTSSNGAYPMQVNGQIFATNATIATSDGRYKQNVREITGGLDLVAALRPVAFRWKSHPVHNFDLAGEQVGFIAQEVQDVLDKATFRDGIVKGNRVRVERGGKDRTGRVLEDGVDEEFFGLAEGKLIPLLVAAVKELKAAVDAQGARIAALEAK